MAKAQGDYIADRPLYLDAAGNLVEANDPNKLTKLADIGHRVSAEDVEKYGLAKGKTKLPTAEEYEQAEAEKAEEAKAEQEKVEGEKSESTSKQLRGHLPEDFPGYAALEAEGHATYAKVRKLIEKDELVAVPGIGEATAEKIKEVFEGEGKE